ncbi:MAG: histidine phosphatase family protein [Paracoccus sp. (in: a-proteobacteria)]|uniref:histidine phosphatase family protein n=1 Tax=Paracoccus sp. TaxID=267 RepID=UPI003919040E
MRVMILRHAPPLTGGTLAGRLDVAADCSDDAAMGWMAAQIASVTGMTPQVWCSAARRCQQTAAALSLTPARVEPALWEQDYGAWEGLAYADLPDLGPLPPEALARHRPKGGESFLDMAARVQPVLAGLREDTLIVGHAGTVRAGLALVVGAQALSFSVAPLSLTVLRRVGSDGAGADWAVEAVNITAPAVTGPL